jgi:dihydrofolate reductase
MRKLSVFESVTANGFFADRQGDMSWAHEGKPDPELQAFVQGNAATPGVLLFGRVTYEMMAGYWPTPAAAKNDPVVARGMNEAEKIVFSRTLEEVAWAGTTVIRSDPGQAVRKLKQQPGKDLVVLGSGSIVSQLAEAGLVDAYQIVVKPVALGDGRPLWEGLDKRLRLALTGSRAFGDGSVVLNYVTVR